MPSAEVEPVAIPSYDKLKMEDRKRSLAHDGDDLAPRSKRLLKDENGQAMRMDAEKEKDVEVCARARVWMVYDWMLTACRATRKTPSCGR